MDTEVEDRLQSSCWRRTGLPFHRMKSSADGSQGWLHKDVKAFNATELKKEYKDKCCHLYFTTYRW